MKNFNISYANALLLGTVIILFSYIGCSLTENSNEEHESKNLIVRQPSEVLNAQMRKLWEDHITWTRNVILCLIDELPGADEAVNRLLQNQVDIGNAIKPYYGVEAGNKLSELLKVHVTISAEVVKAAKASNGPALNEANKRWYANADEISEFLSKSNPNWEVAEMKMMMNEHLKLTTDEAMQRIKKNYATDIMTYDKLHEEVLKMSDMLADGIVLQFPEKFEKE